MNALEVEIEVGALSNEEIKRRFVEECRKFEIYEGMSQRIEFPSEDNPQEVMDELKGLCPTEKEIADFNMQYEGETTYDEDIKKLEDEILYKMIFEGADAIYAEILKCAKLIYSNLHGFGYQKKQFIDLLLEMSSTKEDIDDTKDYDNDNADREIYSTAGRVEAITDRKQLKKHLRS